MSIESLDRAELFELMETPKQLTRGISFVKTANDYLINHKETPEVNWEVVGMVKGAIFGNYYKMRNEGSGVIANHICLEEGISQTLSPRQDLFLRRIDEKYQFKRP